MFFFLTNFLIQFFRDGFVFLPGRTTCRFEFRTQNEVNEIRAESEAVATARDRDFGVFTLR